MHEKGVIVEIGGEEKFLVCNTAAYEIISDKYGDLESMADLFIGPEDEKTDTPEQLAQKQKERVLAGNKIFVVGPWLVALLANEGEMVKNGCEELEKPLTEKYIKRFTSPGDIEQLFKQSMQAIKLGFSTQHVLSENKRDPVLEQLDQKNAESVAEQ